MALLAALGKVHGEVALHSVELAAPPAIGVRLIDDIDDIASVEREIRIVLAVEVVERAHDSDVAALLGVRLLAVGLLSIGLLALVVSLSLTSW